MRCIARIAAAVLLVALGAPLPAQPAAAQAQQNQPAHAWLFGVWTGGLFPTPTGLTAQACLGQPVVIFTRDLVMRATLTDITYVQRLIESARAGGGGVEFRFSSTGGVAPSGVLGLPAPPLAAGFGCENPDVLTVQRRTENEISFPGCADFPYPLIRCPAR